MLGLAGYLIGILFVVGFVILCFYIIYRLLDKLLNKYLTTKFQEIQVINELKQSLSDGRKTETN